MSQITISEIQSDKGSLQFTLSGDHEYGLDKSVVNAIRRTLLNDIPTVAFEIDEDAEKDLTMVTNHSVLHNEMLLHRIALVPLYLDPEDFLKHYFFECHVVHDSTDPFKFITSNDMNIYPLRQHILDRVHRITDQSIEVDPHERESLHTLLQTHSPDNYDLLKPLTQREKDKILRPFEFRGNHHYCMIHELKHTGTEGIYQEVHFFGSPSVKTGRSNSRYQSVSQASYSFIKDDNLVNKVLEDKLTLKQVSEEDKPRFIRKFMLGESDRYFKRDQDNEPNHYLFKIKSAHFWPSEILFQKACQILMDGLDHLKLSIVSILQEKPKSVTLQQKNETTYTLTMNHQSHTLGNAIQNHVSRRSIDKEGLILSCGYKQPHPLEDSIILYLSLNPTHKIMKDTEIHKTQTLLTFMMDQLDELKGIFKSILEISKKNL